MSKSIVQVSFFLVNEILKKGGQIHPPPSEERLIKISVIFFQIVLTGGPCGGKTTGQARLATFFENLGWKVFRVPETATVLLSGGISFGDLTKEQV